MNRDDSKLFVSSLEKIAGGSSLIAIGTFISRFFEYIYKMIVSRIGVEEFGILSLGLAVFGFISAVSYMGIPHGIRRYVPFLRGKSDFANLSGIVNFAFRFTAVSSIIFMFLAFFLAKPIAQNLFHDSRLFYLVIILFSALPFYNLKDTLIKILLGFERIRYRVLAYNIIEPASKAFLAAVFIILGWGITGVFCAYTISMMIVFLAALFLVEFRTFPFIRSGREKTFYMTGEFFMFSLGLILSDFLILAMLWSDTILIGFMRGRYDAGIYNAAMIVASILMFLPELVIPAATPVIVSTFAKDGSDAAKTLFRVTIKWMCAMAIPCAVFLTVFGKYLLSFLFGKQYIAGFGVLVILLMGKLFLSVSSIGNEAIMLLKKTKTIFFMSLTAVILNIGLNIILIPRIGIVGSAIATSISMVLQGAATIFYSQQYFNGGIFNLEMVILILVNVLAGALGYLAWLCGIRIVPAVYLIYAAALTIFFICFKIIRDEDRIFFAAFFKMSRKTLFADRN